jgi:hypothetical protein
VFQFSLSRSNFMQFKRPSFGQNNLLEPDEGRLQISSRRMLTEPDGRLEGVSWRFAAVLLS